MDMAGKKETGNAIVRIFILIVTVICSIVGRIIGGRYVACKKTEKEEFSCTILQVKHSRW